MQYHAPLSQIVFPPSSTVTIKYMSKLGFVRTMTHDIPNELNESNKYTIPEEFQRPMLYFIFNENITHKNIKNILGNPKTKILNKPYNNTYITYSYITSESGTAPDKLAYDDLPADKAICNRDEVMSIINDKELVKKITDVRGPKIKLIQDLFNSSKLAVLYYDDTTGKNGMIHKKKDGTNENTQQPISPSFALIFIYAYKPAPAVAPNNSLPQPESQIIMANNNISPFLTGPTNNNKTKQKELIKLGKSIRFKILNARVSGEIYPIQMPQIGITNIVNSLNPGTGIYLYGTSAQNITSNSKNRINNLNIYYKTNEPSGDIKKYPITPHPETGSQIINGIPKAPLDASIFANIPGQITHIIGRDMQLLSSGKSESRGPAKNPVGIMGGGRIH